jgi:TonB family protein
MPDHPVPEPTTSTSQGSTPGAESDLGELAALFAAHGGGSFSAEVSAQLALEIVLNEIVERACVATGATGAAIVLVRDGEMMCRASSGVNAPVLGAPLGSESGLTAECIKTRLVQLCDDAQADPRADGEASRRLGVRSVMILPLLRKDELAGVLEVFSSRPGAFGDQDKLTLEALAQRILKNLDLASEPLSLAPNAPSISSGTSSSDAVSRDAAAGDSARDLPAAPVAAMTLPEVGDLRAGSATRLNKEEDVRLEIAGRSARAGFDFMSLALAAAVLICAVLLGTLVGVRVGWRKAATMRGQVAKSGSGAGVGERKSAQNSFGQSALAQKMAAQSIAAQSGVAQPDGEAGTNAGSAPGAGSGRAAGREKKNAAAPAGSLLVYENGKEIFRMPPAAEGEGAPSAGPGELQHASALEPAGTVEVAPDVAEGSMLHRVEPEYPEEARKQGIQGAVVLEVRIARDGAIQNVKLVSGQPSLANAAIAAVKQWRFRPRLVQGQPVEMQTSITLNFRLPR